MIPLTLHVISITNILSETAVQRVIDSYISFPTTHPIPAAALFSVLTPLYTK